MNRRLRARVQSRRAPLIVVRLPQHLDSDAVHHVARSVRAAMAGTPARVILHSHDVDVEVRV